MLQTLHIENYAIIDKLTLEFAGGLNVFTGETGAGKSIIVEAMKLLLGGKPAPSCVRTGADRARVEVLFTLDPKVRSEISMIGIEVGEEILIQREIVQGGRGRISIDGRPVTQDILKKVGQRLISISSQHDFQRLLKPSFHSTLLDKYADDGKVRSKYETAWNHWQDCLNQLTQTRERLQSAARELDFLKHELSEINKANLTDNEDENLEDERRKLKGSVKLRESVSGSVSAIYNNNGALEKLVTADKLLSNVDLKGVDAWRDAISRAMDEISSIGSEMSSLASELVENPQRLAEIEDRLSAINTLKRRFGTVEDILNRKKEIEDTLIDLESGELLLQDLQKKEKQANATLSVVATQLTALRKATSIKLEKQVIELLKQLAFNQPNFSIRFNSVDEFKSFGKEGVEFMFAPNPGEDAKPLIQIASGGELSRLHLALDRAAGASSDFVVYDEVDAGIGGHTATAIGKILKQSSDSSQVVCITHLPQVASFADHHLYVSKKVEDGRTKAIAKVVAGNDRIDELARLLGGKKETAIEHAKKMLEQSS